MDLDVFDPSCRKLRRYPGQLDGGHHSFEIAKLHILTPSKIDRQFAVRTFDGKLSQVTSYSHL
jgi:hypothetical protein